MKLNIKRLTNTAKIPTHGSEYAAGYDLYVDSSKAITIQPHETVMLKTGIAMEIPTTHFGAIYPRSGISTKRSLRLANCVAVIDADYRGEIGIPIHNDSNTFKIIEPYERVAQIVFQKFDCVEFEEVNELSDTKRSDGGFGSSGSK